MSLNPSNIKLCPYPIQSIREAWLRQRGIVRLVLLVPAASGVLFIQPNHHHKLSTLWPWLRFGTDVGRNTPAYRTRCNQLHNRAREKRRSSECTFKPRRDVELGHQVPDLKTERALQNIVDVLASASARTEHQFFRSSSHCVAHHNWPGGMEGGGGLKGNRPSELAGPHRMETGHARQFIFLTTEINILSKKRISKQVAALQGVPNLQSKAARNPLHRFQS